MRIFEPYPKVAREGETNEAPDMSAREKGNAREPIARYHEKRFDGERRFELFDDSVRIVGKTWSGQESEHTIALGMLSPTTDSAHARGSDFTAGLWMCLIAILLLESGLLSIFSYFGGLSLCMAIAGALMMMATWRKTRWIMFNFRSGGVAVAIAQNGSDASRFDDFIEAMVERIEAESAATTAV